MLKNCSNCATRIAPYVHLGKFHTLFSHHFLYVWKTDITKSFFFFFLFTNSAPTPKCTLYLLREIMPAAAGFGEGSWTWKCVEWARTAPLCRGTNSATRALSFKVRFKMTVYGSDLNWRHDFGKYPLLQGPTTRPNTDTIQLKLVTRDSEVGFSEFLADYAVSSAP